MAPKYTYLFGLLLALLPNPSSLHAQSIITFAGTGYGATTGTGNYTGDGGAADAATFYHPAGIASDGYSNLYIADQLNHVVRKINYTGTITTVAGSGTAGNSGDLGNASLARLSDPTGVAVDGAENVYIADYSSNVVRKVNSAGVITTVAGTGAAGYSGDGGPAVAAKLNAPYSVALDAAGNLYIADANNNVIRKVDASGVITTIAGNGFGAGLGLGHGGNSGDGGIATNAQLNFPRGVAVDNSGNVYIADAVNNVIREVNTSNIISTVAGNGRAGNSGDGGNAVAASLNAPAGVAVNSHGDIYISDQGNNVVRKVNSSGVISAFAGMGTPGYSGDGGPAPLAQLNAPTSVAVDGSGFVYIADNGNNVIRLVAYPVSVNSIPGKSTAVQVFPNPSNGSFTIELPQTISTASMSIVDVFGRIIETRTIDNSLKSTLTVTDLRAGNYFLKFVSADNTFRETVVVVR